MDKAIPCRVGDFRMRFFTFAILSIVLVLPVSGQAKVNLVTGVATGIESDLEQIISFRQQEHYWYTSDKAAHLLVNLGVDGGLALLSRGTENSEWRKVFSLPGADKASTGDTLLKGNDLHVVYSDAAGAIRYLKSTYDPAIQAWSAPQWSQIYDGTEGLGRAPTLAAEPKGGVYAAFTVLDAVTSKAQIRVSFSSAPLQDWTDTGKRWGALNIGIAKAGRLMGLNDRVGLIYTDQTISPLGVVTNSINWSEPAIPEEPGGVWVDEELYRSVSSGSDPFGTHFSAVADEAGNIFLLWATEHKVRYLRYQGGSRQWNYSQWMLPFSHKAAYVQMVRHRDGRYFAAFNVSSYLVVMESLDGGFTFDFDALLLHVKGLDINWDHPRIEAPQVIDGQLNILQQAKKGVSAPIETLYSYSYTP